MVENARRSELKAARRSERKAELLGKPLTAKELEVASLLHIGGKSIEEAGAVMSPPIARRTVLEHLDRIYMKFGIVDLPRGHVRSTQFHRICEQMLSHPLYEVSAPLPDPEVEPELDEIPPDDLTDDQIQSLEEEWRAKAISNERMSSALTGSIATPTPVTPPAQLQGSELPPTVRGLRSLVRFGWLLLAGLATLVLVGLLLVFNRVLQPSQITPTVVITPVTESTAQRPDATLSASGPPLERTPAATLTLTPAGTAPPVATPAPNATQAWDAMQPELEAVWGIETPKTVDLLDTFLTQFPGFNPAQEKLYAALIAYGHELALLGDGEGALAQFERARSLEPERMDAYDAIVSLTPTPAPIIPTPRDGSINPPRATLQVGATQATPRNEHTPAPASATSSSRPPSSTSPSSPPKTPQPSSPPAR